MNTESPATGAAERAERIEKVERAEVAAAEVVAKSESVAKSENTKPTSSLFNLSQALAKSGHKETTNESEQVAERRYDEAAQSKIEQHKSQILSYLEEWRPRFVPFFEVMQVEGSTIKLKVPTEELRVEILRNETQLLGYLVECAAIDGAIDIEISVDAMVESKKPVRLEDRIAHFTELNSVLIELTEQLDLQVDG